MSFVNLSTGLYEDKARLKMSFMGEGALLFEVPTTDKDDMMGNQKRIWKLAESLKTDNKEMKVVAGINNLLVIFDPLFLCADYLESYVQEIWTSQSNNSPDVLSKIHDIPVIYGGEKGGDLTSVASDTGLSIDEVVELHSQTEYYVYAVGSYPGMPYLVGVDKKLVLPRRGTPRTKVGSGTVLIAGMQSTILPCTSPSGWHAIGHTEVSCFNTLKSPPALFKPGDRVRFVAMGMLI